MEKLKFKTNIMCGNCQAKVAPFLNEEERIAGWKVDLTSEDRILEVETDLSEEEVIEVVEESGFSAERIEQ